MYQYTFSDEDTDKITKKAQKQQELLDSFNKIDEKFTSTSNDSLGLEKMEFVRGSDDQIKKEAESNLADYKTKNTDSIKNEYATKLDNIENSIKNENNEKQESKNEIASTYENLKKSASNDATKRGLARSSIVVNILDAFDNKMLDEYSKIDKEVGAKIDSLTTQKELLSTAQENALNSFDIAYAVKLSDKIAEINKQLNEQEQTVIKYNNEIQEKEAEYKQKQKESALDYATYIEKYGTEGIQKAKQDEKYIYAENYFMSLPKQEAIEELKNNTYISQLGTLNFNKLKVAVLGRKD